MAHTKCAFISYELGMLARDDCSHYSGGRRMGNFPYNLRPNMLMQYS